MPVWVYHRKQQLQWPNNYSSLLLEVRNSLFHQIAPSANQIAASLATQTSLAVSMLEERLHSSLVARASSQMLVPRLYSPKEMVMVSRHPVMG